MVTCLPLDRLKHLDMPILCPGRRWRWWRWWQWTRKTGASNHVGPVKVQPPFINPIIEILVAAKVFIHHYFITIFTILSAAIIILGISNSQRLYCWVPKIKDSIISISKSDIDSKWFKFCNIQDCAEYNFEVKLFAPTSKEVFVIQ